MMKKILGNNMDCGKMVTENNMDCGKMSTQMDAPQDCGAGGSCCDKKGKKNK